MRTPDQRTLSEMDRRTTDVGLYNFAVSYLVCAKTLTEKRIVGLRFADPIEYLFYHSIELFLKSFLRHKGISTFELLSKYGHNQRKLLAEAVSRGLALTKEDQSRIKFIHNNTKVIEARYIVTGAKKVLPIEELTETCSRVQSAVEASLKTDGVVLQPTPFLSSMTIDSSHRTIPVFSDASEAE